MPETNIQRWKSRPIFLSSTFRDMHAERDHLRQKIFPRLEEELLKRRHHLEWIDLRQGVESGEDATEEQRELIVLKVCLDEIKRSRPFLIVLLGDRYGWVPPADRLNAAAREADFAAEDLHSRSVTALEIEFGILKETPDQQRRCFFYFREPLPYDAMLPEVSATYSEQFATDEQAATRWAALEELKKRLTEDEEINPRIRRYSVGWDAEKNTVTGLEAWGQQVSEDLWRELDEETREFASKPAPTWEEIEREALGEFIEQNSRDFVAREDVRRQLFDLATSPEAPPFDADSIGVEAQAVTVNWGACVTGASGTGKSALFAKLVRDLQSEGDVLILANAVGISPRSASAGSMLRRWIGELAAFLGETNPLPEGASVEEEDQTFASLLGRACTKQRVVMLVDAFHKFEPAPRARYMTWRPRLWPPNARLIATSLPGTESESFTEWAGVAEIDMPPLTRAEAREIGRTVWKRVHCPWSEAVWQTLAAKTLPGTARLAAENPLWITLACEQLALLDADDFSRAEREFADERDPQSRLNQLRSLLAENIPPDLAALYEWLFVHIEKIHGEPWVRSFTIALAMGKDGWRERDLKVLVPSIAGLFGQIAAEVHFSGLKLASLRRALRSNIVASGPDQQMDFSHDAIRSRVRENITGSPDIVRGLLPIIGRYLETLPRLDPVRISRLLLNWAITDRTKAANFLAARDLLPEERAAAVHELSSFVAAVGSGDIGIENLKEVIAVDLAPDSVIRISLVMLEIANAIQFRVSAEKRLDFLFSIRTQLNGVAPEHSQDFDWRNAQAICRTLIAEAALLKGNADYALREYQFLVALDGNFLDTQEESDLESVERLAVSYGKLGKVHGALGNFRASLEAHESSRRLWEMLGTKRPAELRFQRALAVSLEQLSDAYLAERDFSGSLSTISNSRRILARLVEDNPMDWGLCQVAAVNRLHYARQLDLLGQQTEALPEYQGANRELEVLLDRDPTDVKLHRDCSIGHASCGDLLLRSERAELAIGELSRARRLLDVLLKTGVQRIDWVRDFGIVLLRLGVAYVGTNRLSEAAAVFRIGSAHLRKVEASGITLEPKIAEFLTQLSATRLDLLDDRKERQIAVPIPYPSAQPEKAARLNLEYQKSLAKYNALPWRKRIRTKRPTPPTGI